MTIWIHTLEGRNYSQDSDDHSLMCRHLEAIDEVCQKIGVKSLGELVDYTDQEYNYEEFDDEDDDEDVALDPETGLAYGIDDMTWFDAQEGLSSFKALKTAVASSVITGLDADEVVELIEELDNCISILEKSAAQAGKFHLSLVE
ncbi:hypothetical protein H8K33_12450 [Undibacterium amnicola]|uniref:Uncharacterized protein n=1 Tax=Undibacterium amnicola TaxID=1834038 RepID=A0ABR6XSB5_9BURK|nr:hypothetical protein [Undibacterium amnicola]MBC3832326.1 hypothetical protein [Undibacterium amnicola]